jgi:hypothetical protein
LDGPADDWLAQFRANPPEPELTPRDTDSIIEEERPSVETGSALDYKSPVEEKSTTGEPPESLPSWLVDLRSNAASVDDEPTVGTLSPVSEEPVAEVNPGDQPQAATGSAPGQASDETVPDWLSEIKSGTSPAEPSVPTVVPEETYTDASPVADESPTQIAPPSPPRFDPTSVEPTVIKSEPMLPDWLKSVSSTNAPVEAVSKDADWVSHVARPLEDSGLDTTEGLADWFSETTTTEEEILGSPPQTVTLEEGEIPDWVQSLRPADSVPLITPLPEQKPLTSGFLAGYSGILPLSPVVALPKEAILPAKAEPHLNGAQAFSSVLSAPAELVEGLRAEYAPAATLSWLGRIALYLILLLAVLIPLLLPSELSANLSDSLGASVVNSPAAGFFDVTHTVKPGSTVVMSFDYSVGQAGELDPAASAVMNDLLKRNVRVLAVSTTTTGPALAQAVFDRLASRSNSLVYGSNFVNLGFVPSGGTGLRSLANNGFSIFKADNRNIALKSLSALTNVRGLADTALTIEIAGDEGSLKDWVEQVQAPTRLPLAAIVSAQAEPQARTYRDARQVTAVLSGLVRAAEYELLSNSPGRATASLDAQSFAHIALALLIVAGNIAFLMSRARKKV